MMKPSSIVVFLLALHFLLYGVYGARLAKFTASQLTKLDVVEEEDQSSTMDKILENKCKDNEDHCSKKGINRKLITSPTLPTSIAKPIHKNLDNEGKKMGIKRDDKAQKLSSSSSSKHSSPPSLNHHHHHTPLMAFEVDNKHTVVVPPEYENAMDMTVMDYSPAKRKPPIHN